MILEQEMIGHIVVLNLSGTMTLGAGDGLLKDKVHSVVHQGYKQIALNLGGLSYMDSAGLGELVSAYTTITRAGGQVKLFDLTKRVSDLLVISKLLSVFDVYDSRQDALQAFGQ